MRRPRPTIFALIISAFALFPVAAQACQCIETGTPPCARFWRAQAVFVAAAIEIYPPPDEHGVYPDETLVRLSVEEVYRGKVAKEVFERQGGGADCKVVFQTGQRYLLYSYDYDPKTKRVATSICTGSGELADDDADLKYIQGLSKRKPEQNIYGRLARGKYTALPGIRILVEGNGKKYRAITDQEGDYKIALPKAGTYKVSAIVPFSGDVLEYEDEVPHAKASATEERTVIEYEVNVPEGQCSYKELNVYAIDLKAIAEIGGKVLDVEGKPCPSLTLYLYPATEGQEFSGGDYEFARTDEDGRYIFRGLRGGRYWLGVNLGRMPEVDEPYPATFYPGVTDRAHATIINLEEGQKLSTANLRLPPKLVEREITGVILWPDGKPVTKGPSDSGHDARPDITLLDSRRLSSLSQRRNDGSDAEKIDEKGQFSIVGFEGYTYVIFARAFDANDKPMRSRYMRIKLTEDFKPLKLILSVRGDKYMNEDEIKKELDTPP